MIKCPFTYINKNIKTNKFCNYIDGEDCVENLSCPFWDESNMQCGIHTLIEYINKNEKNIK